MNRIQVVLDSELLRATNRAAKRARLSRSALVRDALREHLKLLRTRELEACDRQGYLRHPDTGRTAAAWERVASWPEDALQTSRPATSRI